MHSPQTSALDLLASPAVAAAAQQGLLVLARILPLALLAPIFGGAGASFLVRLAAALMLALAITPALGLGNSGLHDGATLALLAAKEVLVGLTLAMFVRVLVGALWATGLLVDLTRGAGLVNVLDSGAPRHPSPLAAFASMLGVTLFVTAGGHGVVLAALADSFASAPPSEPLPVSFVGRPAAEAMISLTAELFVVAVRLAAPLIVLVLLLDAALGLLSRLATPMHAYFLGLSLKGLIALLMLAALLAVAYRSAFSPFMDAMTHWASPTRLSPGP